MSCSSCWQSYSRLRCKLQRQDCTPCHTMPYRCRSTSTLNSTARLQILHRSLSCRTFYLERLSKCQMAPGSRRPLWQHHEFKRNRINVFFFKKKTSSTMCGRMVSRSFQFRTCGSSKERACSAVVESIYLSKDDAAISMLFNENQSGVEDISGLILRTL